MDSNYVYMRAAQKGEDFSRFNLGDIFGGGGDGGGDGSNAAAIGLGVLGLATAWMGSKKAKEEAAAQQAAAQQAAIYAQQNTKPKNNTALYVVGGLAVVGIGVAIFLAARKK